MLIYREGDIFESGAEALVNAVNAVGLMGKGLAYQFKQRFPQNNKDYIRACRDGSLQAGGIHVTQYTGEPTIINVATKDNWKDPSKREYVENGLKALAAWLDDNLQITTIAVPALGCGNGGLAWDVVKPLIEETLGNAMATVFVYAPSEAAAKESTPEPRVGIVTLILLKISARLNPFRINTLKEAVEEMNTISGETVISTDLVMPACKTIAEYKKYHNIDNAKAEEMVYKRICSKTVDSRMERLAPIIEMACERVNALHAKQPDSIDAPTTAPAAKTEKVKTKPATTEPTMPVAESKQEKQTEDTKTETKEPTAEAKRTVAPTVKERAEQGKTETKKPVDEPKPIAEVQPTKPAEPMPAKKETTPPQATEQKKPEPTKTATPDKAEASVAKDAQPKQENPKAEVTGELLGN